MIKPLNGHVLVRLIDQDKNSGVLTPENFRKEETSVGEVIAIPDEADCGVGDKLIFDKYAPSHVKINDEKYYFVKMEDVMGIYTE